MDDTNHAVSPSGRWEYRKMILPRGAPLQTYQGKKRGEVRFDAAVLIPSLFELPLRNPAPWMSLTPMELLSLRAGTKKAHGRVVIAGLGLGHQLIEVSKRRHVTHITLIEREQDLVDWILPRVREHMHRPERLEVRVGDVADVLPELTADIALIDTFPHYGGNAVEGRQLAKRSPGIKRVWCWGA